MLVYSGSDGAYRFFRHCTEMKIAPVRPMHRSIRNKGMDQTPLFHGKALDAAGPGLKDPMKLSVGDRWTWKTLGRMTLRQPSITGSDQSMGGWAPTILWEQVCG